MGIIRFLLALSVVATHCGPIFGFQFVGGPIAVQSFFIISGFYMSMILNEKYIGVNNSFWLFISNRFIRLYPIYWVILLTAIFTYFILGFITNWKVFPVFDSYASVKTNIISLAYLIVTHLAIFGQDVMMFMGVNPNSGSFYFTPRFWETSPQLHTFLFIPQAWSLSLELMFYLVAPFILKRGVRVVIVLIFLSLLLRLFIYSFLHLENDPWSYRFFPTEIIFFLIGYLSYQIYLQIQKYSIPKYFVLVLLFGMISFTCFYFYFPSNFYFLMLKNFPFTTKEILYFLGVTLCIPFFFNFFKKISFDKTIGELSYPIYISHMMIYIWCNNSGIPILKTGWCVAVITIIFAYLLNKYITLPIEKYRQGRLQK